MGFESFLNNIILKRMVATVIDFSIEFGGGLLGGYFGAMLAALVVVLQEVPPTVTQKAVWTGMSFGFFFWGVTTSWVNRVLIQGISRATIGKKFMNLEIVSTGAPISWPLMMRHWLSATLMSDVKVVSALETKLAPVYSIHSNPAADQQKSAESSDKKAA